jgi:hypothetical protein
LPELEFGESLVIDMKKLIPRADASNSVKLQCPYSTEELKNL